jgi:type I restriction enzyme S subunit
MQVKPGYKQTEVGVIPDEWQVTRLREITHIATGNTPPTRDAANYGDEFLFVSPVDLGEAKHVTTTEKRLSKKGFAISRRFPKNAILFVCIGSTIGKCGVAPVELTANQQINAIFPSPAFSVDYLYYFICCVAPKIKALAGEQAVPIVNKTQFSETVVALPPLAEQRAIAGALGDVDALLGALEKLIAKKRDLKQAAMQQLLTGQKRLPGFSEGEQSYRPTKFGMMPSDWAATSLERIAAFITKGATPTTYGFDWQNEGVLFLRSECVSERGLDLSQSMFISQAAHQALRRSEVRAGDILITITGNVGRVIYLSRDLGEANINQHIARIRIIHEQVAIPFVFHFLSQRIVRRYYNLITTGQAYPQISLKQVRETEVPLPSLPEQTAIAEVLSDMDAEIAALEQRLAKTRVLKQGMMQELLTRKTRLV